jgi:glutamate-1-semialdehyde 2,1-aminomutase
VPRDLRGTVFTFNYNKIDELEGLVANHDIGVVKMEVSRNEGPKDNFLKKVKKICVEKNIVLIFDECTSGFRESFGGLHKRFDVDPDMAVFGKALGNGYAITSVIGRRYVMECAQNTFISSTFWTERIGSTAAIKTLEIMDKLKSWIFISKQGAIIKSKWKDLSIKHKIEIKIEGLNALPRFSFKNSSDNYFKTYISKEFLKRNFLAGNAIYLCIDHKKNILDKYFEIMDEIFFKIKKNIENREMPESLLKGPVALTGLRNKINEK